MNELMIIAFALSCIRTLTPLTKDETYNKASTVIIQISLAIFTCWAFWHLIANCATITF